MNELRQELKDEQLEAVAGGKRKKLTKKVYKEAQQEMKEANQRAQELMQNNRAF